MPPTVFKPASADVFRIALVNIDNENDFSQKGGSLYVPGADKAASRTANFIETYLERITTTFSSFDKHGHRHIFYNIWWQDAQGNHPSDLTQITYDDVLHGIWIPIYDSEWSINYVRTLGSITIWPIHCPADGPGSEMVAVIAKAIG